MSAMSGANTISSAVAVALIEAVRSLGLPVGALFQRIGIDPAAPLDAEQHVGAQSYLALWELVMQLVQDPAFPVRVGSRFEIEVLEAFGFLAMSCKTLREAYERTARFRSLYNTGSRWQLTVTGNQMRMTWHPWELTGRSELAQRSVNEYEVAEMLASIRKLTDKHLVPTRIAFQHRAPRDTSVHRELLGRAPDFDADFDGFEAEATWLDEPIRSHNARLREYFDKQCTQAQQAFANDPPFASQVRQRLVATMDGRRPDMQAIARTLGTSPRSLHRRLADEGTGFNDLLDEVRKDFAKRYLARPRLSIGEVGFLIGFTDSSAFFKAFRRWTGITPSEYRLSLPPAEPDLFAPLP
jgi:AraC-like DNA-binding protein